MASTSASPQSPDPSPGKGDSLPHDSVAQVVTTDLVVRSEPGVSEASEIYPTRLNEPMLLYVVDGPVRASGFDWYLVQPFYDEGCVDICLAPVTFGWVARAGKDGEVWVAPASMACPSASVARIEWLPLPSRLACFAGETLQLRGRVSYCFNELMGGILFEAGCTLHTADWEPIDALGPPGLTLRFDGSVTVLTRDGSVTTLPNLEGALIEVIGMFDDPRAVDCGPDQQMVLQCRSEFVVSQIRLLD